MVCVLVRVGCCPRVWGIVVHVRMAVKINIGKTRFFVMRYFMDSSAEGRATLRRRAIPLALPIGIERGRPALPGRPVGSIYPSPSEPSPSEPSPSPFPRSRSRGKGRASSRPEGRAPSVLRRGPGRTRSRRGGRARRTFRLRPDSRYRRSRSRPASRSGGRSDRTPGSRVRRSRRFPPS